MLRKLDHEPTPENKALIDQLYQDNNPKAIEDAALQLEQQELSIKSAAFFLYLHNCPWNCKSLPVIEL